MPTPRYPKSITARPTLTVDQNAVRVIGVEKPNPSYPGLPGPFGRQRIVTCLPTNGDGPVQVVPAVVFADATAYLVDIDGNFVGSEPLFIHRLVSARWVEDTRRLGG